MGVEMATGVDNGRESGRRLEKEKAVYPAQVYQEQRGLVGYGLKLGFWV